MLLSEYRVSPKKKKKKKKEKSRFLTVSGSSSVARGGALGARVPPLATAARENS